MLDLDIATVRSFLRVAELKSFTRAADALGVTQAAVSMKLQRLEGLLGQRLVERSPRAVTLTIDGNAFLDRARVLIAAHDAALNGQPALRHALSIGISDHAAGPELVPLIERLSAASPQLALVVSIDFSRTLLAAYDGGSLDAVVIRQEAGRRGGELLAEDDFGWFASPRFQPTAGEPLRLGMLAPACGVRALAVRALDKARIGWIEAFVGGGVSAVVAAAQAGVVVAPLARRIAPPGLIDIGPRLGLPRLPRSKVMLHSRVSDPARLAALRTLAAGFRRAVAA